ncbi:MAG: hypothetical protein Q8L45_13240 [Xanthomonadaceae bacterium]|nr:hypothetical protein [Xanthomonadaceae bacterium]MDP2184429.1 hypothetical protein [Xanthomonadales bacterium]
MIHKEPDSRTLRLEHIGVRDFALSAFTDRPEVAHIDTRLIFEYRRNPELPVFASGTA